MAAAVPNFFLIGAPKCGTTSLARYLAQHPAVYMSPIKEPCFFAPEVVDYDKRAREIFDRDAEPLRRYLNGPMREPRQDGMVTDWSDYLKLFARVRGETAVGEASVAYLASPRAALAIRARLPAARMLAVLRDPADRLFSHYTAARAFGATDRTFIPWMNEQIAAEAARTPRAGPAWAGHYAMHLRRYLEAFPRAQVRTYLYEDYSANPAGVVADIFGVLDVDPACVIDFSERHNVTTTPRWPQIARMVRPMAAVARVLAPRIAARFRDLSRTPIALVPTPDERARAIAHYADDIRGLEPLIDRRLSAWLDVERRP